jgi:hypothetical protein
MTSLDLSATLATVSLVHSASGNCAPCAIRLSHLSCDSQTFWASPDAVALVLDAAGLHVDEYELRDGCQAQDSDGVVTEEVRVVRVTEDEEDEDEDEEE